MDNEKTKALSREYAEDVFRDFRERNINHLTDEEWELSIDEVAKDTMDAFQWLSKTHCIVERSKVIEMYAEFKLNVFRAYSAPATMLVKASNIEVAKVNLLEYLFGEELFNTTEK